MAQQPEPLPRKMRWVIACATIAACTIGASIIYYIVFIDRRKTHYFSINDILYEFIYLILFPIFVFIPTNIFVYRYLTRTKKLNLLKAAFFSGVTGFFAPPFASLIFSFFILIFNVFATTLKSSFGIDIVIENIYGFIFTSIFAGCFGLFFGPVFAVVFGSIVRRYDSRYPSSKQLREQPRP